MSEAFGLTYCYHGAALKSELLCKPRHQYLFCAKTQTSSEKKNIASLKNLADYNLTQIAQITRIIFQNYYCVAITG